MQKTTRNIRNTLHFCPCLSKQTAKVKTPLILNSEIQLLMAWLLTPPAEPLLLPRYSGERVESCGLEEHLTNG